MLLFCRRCRRRPRLFCFGPSREYITLSCSERGLNTEIFSRLSSMELNYNCNIWSLLYQCLASPSAQNFMKLSRKYKKRGDKTKQQVKKNKYLFMKNKYECCHWYNCCLHVSIHISWRPSPCYLDSGA